METILKNQSGLDRIKKNRGVLIDIVTYLYVLLFVYTAYNKFTSIAHFEKILSLSPLTGDFSVFISWAVPLSEAIVSILLIIPIAKRVGLYAALLLMVSFTIFLIYGLASGNDLPCQCGGVISSMSWKQHLWFNSGFIVLAILGLMLYKKE